MRRIFIGPNGLRAGWRFAIFLLLVTFAFTIAIERAAYWLAQSFFAYQDSPGWSRGSFLLDACIATAALFLVALVVAKFERRSFADYGLPRLRAKLFGEGALWGFVTSSLVLVMIWAVGGASFHGLATSGTYLATSLILWVASFFLLALYEEFFFRGYSLATLASGMGFWPAAALLTLLFGAVHMMKPQENWIDVSSVMLYGLFWAFTVRRTGSLWFAIGFHFMANFTEMAIFGAPNTGNLGKPLAGHMFDVQFHGPEWLTGGPRGTEASVFVLVVLAATFALFNGRFQAKALAAGTS
ncbi:MAG: CPBP family intramembrane metalloprotease [Acidobacteriales bacterium]|nr:CPBP family intramembrane metalloprotease [Terriglobales bacterium]